jgi:hypothetical protein
VCLNLHSYRGRSLRDPKSSTFELDERFVSTKI